ncbi:MAG: peptidase M3, partial [Treponema sp.]|nr:peptidase M3 [Treponema sp.]
MPNGTKPPRWNLASVYPSFDSPAYREDKRLLGERIGALTELLKEPIPAEPAGAVSRTLSLIRAWEAAGDTAENLAAYVEAVYGADTRDGRALAEINAVEAARLPLGKAAVILRNRLAERGELLRGLAETDADLRPYAFFIGESLKRAAFQMDPELEDLANDLARSGGDAWTRLHGAISSTVQVPWDPATGEVKTVVALRDLAFSPDRAVRERAYRAELEAWKRM